MNDIFWISVVSMGGLGLLFAAGLAFASKKFAVQTDPRINDIKEALPGVNCGACGYPGCDSFAEAIAAGNVEASGCLVLGSEQCSRIAQIMGMESVCIQARMVARVLCGGDKSKSREKYKYYGISDCDAANKLGGGSKSCIYGCLGLGNCVTACPFDSIYIEDGLAIVDAEKCKGCGKCIKECPKNLIEMIPASKQVVVSCISVDKGKQVKTNCDVGCIGCRLCVKACEFEAIIFDNNIARINYDKCTNCMACAKKCPTKAIQIYSET